MGHSNDTRWCNRSDSPLIEEFLESRTASRLLVCWSEYIWCLYSFECVIVLDSRVQNSVCLIESFRQRNGIVA